MRFYKGKRISIESHPCTVRYIGKIEGASKEWLGIEWDNPTRGKHNGCHGKKQYFDCLSKGPIVATFVRPTRPIDEPLSFLDALEKKYIAEDAIEADSNTKHVYFNGKLAEEIGFDKIRKKLSALHHLKIVMLDGLKINRLFSIDYQNSEYSVAFAASIRLINQTCPKIEDLSISQNLFESFEDILGICSALDNIESLDISRNRFLKLELSYETYWARKTPYIKGVKKLKLDSTLLSWKQIVQILRYFPSLSDLSLASNELIEIAEQIYLPILTIDLSYNDFDSLFRIMPLGKMKSLQRLLLHGCPLNAVGIHADMISPSVTFLDVARTNLSTEDLCRLDICFPSIESLRCSIASKEDKLQVIARLPDLKVLNHSKVTIQNRTDAEMYYLGLIAREIKAHTAVTEAAMLSRHPRWKALCQKYGRPDISRRNTLETIQGNTLESKLITLDCRDSRSSDKRRSSKVEKQFQIKLPRSVSLQRAYMRVAERLQTLPLLIRVIWETDEWDPIVGEASADTTEFSVSTKDICQQSRSLKVPGRFNNLAEETHYDALIPSGNADIEAVVPTSLDTTDEMQLLDRDNRGMTKREVVLSPSSNELGFWIEGGYGKLRIESSDYADLLTQ